MTDLLDERTAWKILGRSPDDVFKSIKNKPLHGKIEQAKSELEMAKQLAKFLMIKHHPDKGGDAEKFKRVQQALFSLEQHTERFSQKVMDKIRDEEANPKKQLIFK